MISMDKVTNNIIKVFEYFKKELPKECKDLKFKDYYYFPVEGIIPKGYMYTFRFNNETTTCTVLVMNDVLKTLELSSVHREFILNTTHDYRNLSYYLEHAHIGKNILKDI